MGKKISFITLMILCFSVGCKKPNESMIANQTFCPLEECKEVSELSPYIDTIEIIKVDVNEDSYISDVAKVLLDSNGNFYILDVKGNLIVVNSDGTIPKRIIHQGRAANEYLHIDDIALTDNELMILDGSTIKYFKLNDFHDARIIKALAKTPFDAIAPYKDGGAYLFSSFPADYEDARKENDYLLYCMDDSGQILTKDIAREDCTFSIGNITQSYDNTYYLRPQNNKHVFYQLTTDGIIPKYQVDFKNATIPERYFFENAKEDIGIYMQSDFFKLPIYLHETLTHLFFNAAGPDAVEYNFLYDKTRSGGIRWRTTKGDPTMHISASDKFSFFIFLSGFTPKDSKKLGPLATYIYSQLNSYPSDQNDMLILKLKFRPL